MGPDAGVGGVRCWDRLNQLHSTRGRRDSGCSPGVFNTQCQLNFDIFICRTERGGGEGEESVGGSLFLHCID